MSTRVEPEVGFVLFTIAAAVVFLLYGIILGAVWLLVIWGTEVNTRLIPLGSHPYVQIFGFVSLFIMGTSYRLVTRFKNKNLQPRALAYVSVSLWLLGVGIYVLSGFLQSRAALLLFANGSLLVSAICYAILIFHIVGFSYRGELALSEPYLEYAAVMLVATVSSKLLFDLGSIPVHPSSYTALMQVALLGFPAMMIFGVELRTVHFRAGGFKKSSALTAFLIFILASSATILGSLGVSPNAPALPAISSSLWLVGGLLIIDGLRVFKTVLPKTQLERMVDRDRKGYEYFTFCLRLASVWLILGLVFGLTVGLQHTFLGFASFGYYDSFIHSISVGFIGSTILAYAPMLLPPLMTSHAVHRSLSLLPIVSLTLGNALRIIGNVTLELLGTRIPYVGYSGFLILIAIGLFFRMAMSIKRELSLKYPSFQQGPS